MTPRSLRLLVWLNFLWIEAYQKLQNWNLKDGTDLPPKRSHVFAISSLKHCAGDFLCAFECWKQVHPSFVSLGVHFTTFYLLQICGALPSRLGIWHPFTSVSRRAFFAELSFPHAGAWQDQDMPPVSLRQRA